jgi:surfactin synthase thioesterase subunit
MSSNKDWFAFGTVKPSAKLRLFCLPFVGGSANAFRRWVSAFPPEIEVWPVELPGRGMRLGEPPIADARTLVAGLLPAMKPMLDRPFALFGHSMGGRIALLLAMTLRSRGLPAPVHLFASASKAPQLQPRRVADLPWSAFMAELRRRGGTPPEVLADRDLMQMFEPIVRADFKLYETFDVQGEPPLAVPITALLGTEDHIVTEDKLAPWQTWTTATFRIAKIDADHFFLTTAQDVVIAEVCRDLL